MRTRRTITGWLFSLQMLLALGCGEPPQVIGGMGGSGGSGADGAGGGAGAPPVPLVVLGTGEAEFEPMEDEPTLDMAAGFQGGFHVWTSLIAYHFDEILLDMVLVTEIDGEPDSALTMRHTLRGTEGVDAEGEPAWTFAGYPAQVRDARCANGKRLRIEVTLLGSDGREASDERYCYLALDEDYRDDDCD